MPMIEQFRLTKQKKFVLAVDGKQNLRLVTKEGKQFFFEVALYLVIGKLSLSSFISALNF